jgi:DNA-binding SARP family transcriptional activator
LNGAPTEAAPPSPQCLMALRIRTLDSLSFATGAEDVAALHEQPVRAALLVVLAVERELSRERLLALLWPERDPAHARHALNQTLYLIRRDLGTDLCEVNGDRIRAASALQADVQEFRDAVAAEHWNDALRLYQGEFLQGWYLTGSRPFEEWVERHRADLRRKLREHSGVPSRGRSTEVTSDTHWTWPAGGRPSIPWKTRPTTA